MKKFDLVKILSKVGFKICSSFYRQSSKIVILVILLGKERQNLMLALRIQNPIKAIMSEILEDVLGQVVQKRWLCPLCDRQGLHRKYCCLRLGRSEIPTK